MIPSLPLTDTINSFADLRTVVPSGRKSILLRYHTNPNDGGGGIFDIVPVGSYVDDNGTVAVSGSFALVRRGSEVGPINVAWFGIVGDGTTDWTVQLQALFDSLPVGRELYIPRGLYRITDTLHVRNAPNGGFIFRGEGCIDPNPNNKSTTLIADFATQSGTAATISSIVDHNPVLDPYSKVVTLTGLTGIGSAQPGDTIKISNAAEECNNGYFTIMSVYPDDGYVTFLGFNAYAHALRYEWFPVLPESNNGSLHWEIRKPMVSVYTRDVLFDTIFFEGNNTCGACVDSTAPGSGGVPNGSFLNTNVRFTNVRMVRGFTGVKIGDFSGYATGGCSEVTWTNNCDFHVFDFCSITLMDYACIYIPNATSNSLQHTIKDTSLQYAQYGIAIRRASFVGYNINFTSNTGADILNLGPSDPCALWGGGSEHSTRFLVLGLSGYMTASPVPIPFMAVGVRMGSSNAELPADKCFMQISSLGSVTFKDCQFFYGNEMTFGAQGYHPYENKRQVSMTFEGCSFSCATPNDIVTAMPGPFNHKVWYSCLSCTTRNGADVPTQVPNGILEAKGPAGTTETAFPLFQIGQLGTPVISTSSLLVDGYNNSVTNPYRTSVTVTGPTAAVILNGITAGENGQRLDLRLSYNQVTTINHLSSSAAAGARIVTLSATPIVLPAPGANSYSVLQLQYDPLADSASGAWVVKGVVRPIDQEPEVLVTTIADLRALTFNPKLVHVTRYAAAGTEDGGGLFEYVPGDTTTPDNSGTWFVNAVGGRYFRRTDLVTLDHFGCDPTGAVFSDTQFDLALTWLQANSKYRSLRIPDGRYKLQEEHTISADQVTITGNGRNSILEFSGGVTKSLFKFSRLCSGLRLKNFRVQGLATCGKAVLDCSTGTGGWLEFDVDLVIGGGWTYWLYATEDGYFQRGAFQWGTLRLSNLQDGAVGDPHNYGVNGIYVDGGYFNACHLIYIDATGLTGDAIHIRQMTGYSGTYCTTISGSTQTCYRGMYIENGELFSIVNYAAEGNTIGDTIKGTEFIELRSCIISPLILQGVSNSLFSALKGQVTQDINCFANDFDRSCSASNDPLTRFNLSDRVRLGLRTTGHQNREPAGFGSFDPQNILLNGDTSRYIGTVLWGVAGNYAAVKCGVGQSDTTRTRNAQYCAKMGPAIGNVGPWIARFKISPALDSSLLHCKAVVSVKWKLAAGTGAPGYVLTDNTSIGADVVTGYGGEVACENGFTIQTVSTRITQAIIDNGLAFVFFGTNTQNFYVAEVTANIGEVAPRTFYRCERSPFWDGEINADGSIVIPTTGAIPTNDPIFGSAWQAGDRIKTPTAQLTCTVAGSPGTWVRLITNPTQVSGTLTDGYNNAVSNPFRTTVNMTGPTATAILNGIVAGEPGQALTLRLKYNQITEINHLSSLANAGRRIITPDTNTLSLWAPGTSPAYNILSLEYDTAEDSGNGAWVVTGYISGSTP